MSFSDVWRASRADWNSICPLDRVLTYKNLIYLLNLQVFFITQDIKGEADKKAIAMTTVKKEGDELLKAPSTPKLEELAERLNEVGETIWLAIYHLS